MKRILLTVEIACAAHPDVRRLAECRDVESMWVDAVARGMGSQGGSFPVQRVFDTVIYVVNEDTFCSTQIGVHFAETEFRIAAPERLLFPIDGALDSPAAMRHLGRLGTHRKIERDEALRICSECAAEPRP